MSKEFVFRLAERLRQSPELSTISRPLMLEITDGGLIHIADGVVTHQDAAAACRLSVSAEIMQAMVDGRVNAMTAMRLGKLRIEGDMALAQRLASLLAAPPAPTAAPLAPPPGFRPLPMSQVGDLPADDLALHVKQEDGHAIAGFRVTSRHCNLGGTCHGGVLATFCDIYLSLAALFEGRLNAMMLPTVSLSLDYLAAARPGAWVQGRADILKAARSLVFVQALVRADGEAVVRANGVFMVPSPTPGGFDTGAWLRAFLEH